MVGLRVWGRKMFKVSSVCSTMRSHSARGKVRRRPTEHAYDMIFSCANGPFSAVGAMTVWGDVLNCGDVGAQKSVKLRRGLVIEASNAD